jgi:DNA topoisomerase I
MVETDETKLSETETDLATESETETASPGKGKGKGKSSGKATCLVVVESPAKARTIKKYLGAGYTVKASVGHVKDLPTRTTGVDVDNGFTPSYEVIKGKQKVIDEIRASAKEVQEILLAPDPDREGEAIAWHIAEEIRPINPNIQRILFNEITKKGVAEGLAHPRPLDQAKFESQQARRILDRLVGYEISPLLWKKVRRGLSAGRVQSVAVRLVVEREEQVEAFTPREYWNIVCTERTTDGVEFEAKLVQLEGKKPAIGSGDDSASIVAELERMPHRVASLELRQRPRKPLPPFITSKLQQEAARAFRFPAKRTMGLAQRLYEGIDLGGDEGVVGLITYMRTDSTRISDDALGEVRTLIKERWGDAYLPEQPLVYAAAKRAQDAHEAIRPTSVALEPEALRERILAEFKPTAKTTHGLTRHEAEDLMRLYGLIWRRFVACQMNPAIYDQTVIDIAAGDGERLLLRAQGQAIAFPGYQAVYEEAREDGSSSANGNGKGQGEGGGVGGPDPREEGPAHDAPGRRAPHARERDPGAEVHPAAAAVLRGHAGQGARGAGHRPALDLRRHHLHHPGPQVRGQGRGPVQALDPRPHGEPDARGRVPGHPERRVHGPHGGPAGPHRRRRRELGHHAPGVLHGLPRAGGAGQDRDAAARQGHGHRLRGVRRPEDDRALGSQRSVPGVPGLPRVPEHQGDPLPRPGAVRGGGAQGDHRGLRALRRAHGSASSSPARSTPSASPPSRSPSACPAPRRAAAARSCRSAAARARCSTAAATTRRPGATT